MALALDPKEIVEFREMLMVNTIQVDTMYQLLIQKGYSTEAEFLAKMKDVQADYQGGAIIDMRTMQIQWRDGKGESVKIGYVNRNGQKCCGHCGVAGTDHEQYAYKSECTLRGYVYGANGSDMHLRLCPECQNGAPGIKYWRTVTV